MIVTNAYLIAFALAAAAPAQPAAPDPGFSGLFTRWGGANSEALRAETARQAPAAAAAGPLRAGSPELGARVGEIVRSGDCAEGERVARAAGDFPLVEAVRSHCRGAIPAMSRR
ncbi:MAG: hypothetical protein QOJ53_1279 [Sphingomonadales bacterium]|jgi:hypothetical protein|nr:hypothetical protein [Sphingomonadales bacterium]MEA3043841.1 hypothetical protein [Sphingomonadales bacterium]MEA3046947.1 hypothetical protein [Sphingomonadales bacterium]